MPDSDSLKILGIGNATVDLIDQVAQYPQEDSEVRALSRQFRFGGNTLNTLVVLSQLGHQAALAGTLADDSNGDIIRSSAGVQKIDLRLCAVESGMTPLSHICIAADTGSRSIVHYRDLPELSASALRRIVISDFDWIHLEGRNIEVLFDWLQELKRDLPLSLEIEKDRPGIDRLAGFARVLLFSKHYALSKGFTEPEPFLNMQQAQYPTSILVCAWGDQGAWAVESAGQVMHVPATALVKVVDSVAAGDVFNAGIIHALSAGMALEDALQFATQLAGRSCAQQGILGLL